MPTVGNASSPPSPSTRAWRVLRKFSVTLAIKGALMLAAGTLALIFPAETLLGAMLSTAVLLAATGAYEMLLALRTRVVMPAWFLSLADGAASVGLAVLSVSITAISFRTTMLLVALWLLLYSALAIGLALALWPMRRTRLALLGWAVLDFGLGALAAFDGRATIFTLLYVGAAYAIAFGVFQLAAAWWLRRFALPRFAPTLQSTWKTPHTD
jgi:uncharacterized membrane protein HdeD (DUF308 family)